MMNTWAVDISYAIDKLVIKRLSRTIYPLFSSFLIFLLYFHSPKHSRNKSPKNEKIRKFWLHCPLVSTQIKLVQRDRSWLLVAILSYISQARRNIGSPPEFFSYLRICIIFSERLFTIYSLCVHNWPSFNFSKSNLHYFLSCCTYFVI